MSEINKYNYEAYLLDYQEGVLTSNQINLLLDFFDKHPDLKGELINANNIKLISTPEITINKNSIKEIPVEDLVIKNLENIISSEEKNELQKIKLENKKVTQLISNYNKTILLPPNINFPHKNDLKKKDKKVIYLYWQYAAAAVLIVFLSTFLINLLTTNTVKNNKTTYIKRSAKLPYYYSNKTQHNKQKIDFENTNDKKIPLVNKQKTTTLIYEPNRVKKEKSVDNKIEEQDKPSTIELNNTDEIFVSNQPVNHTFYNTEDELAFFNEEEIEPQNKISKESENIIIKNAKQLLEKNKIDLSQNKNSKYKEYAVNVGRVGFYRKTYN